MTTIAITAEYLLAGLLVLCVFVAPLVGDLSKIAALKESSPLWFAVAGAAYLLGVVADRLSEHILEPLGSHETLRKSGLLSPKSSVPDADPLPLDRLTLAVREQGEGLLQWHEQLRGRLRVTRNLTVYGHWAVAAIALLTTRSSHHVSWELPVLAGAVLSLQAWVAVVLKVPRTDEFVEKYAKSDEANASDREKHEKTVEAARRDLRERGCHPLWLLIPGPLVVAVFLAWQLPRESFHWLGLPFFGILAWCASLHAWWKIHKTFLGFLKTFRDHKQSMGRKRAGKTRPRLHGRR